MREQFRKYLQTKKKNSKVEHSILLFGFSGHHAVTQ